MKEAEGSIAKSKTPANIPDKVSFMQNSIKYLQEEEDTPSI